MRSSVRCAAVPKRERLTPEAPAPEAVQASAATLPAGQWQQQVRQEGRQGRQVAAFACLRVVVVRDGWPGPAVGLVLRRSHSDGE